MRDKTKNWGGRYTGSNKKLKWDFAGQRARKERNKWDGN